MRIFRLLCLLTCCLAGCHSDRVATYPVSGKVQFSDGEPVRTGVIELESVQRGTTATGRIEQDGAFTLGTYTEDDGAAAGEHRVIVVQMVIHDGSIDHTQDHGRGVPQHYRDYAQSPLQATVEANEQNQLLITLDMDE